MTASRRVLSALVAFILALLMAAPALAVTPDDYNPETPAILENDHLYAETAYLIDMDTGEILLNKNSRVRVYPASTTKIMTLILAVESGRSMDEQVTIPPEAGDVPEGSSVIGIKPGDVMTWGDLLYGFMLRSGNDGSNAIAVLVSGSIPAFVQAMNAKAAQLGCEGTHFVNAHGYHDADHYTTGRDLARMSLYGMQNETFRQIVGTAHREITVTRGGKTGSTDAENRNSLLVPESKYYYPGATGIKTGHHSQSGRCVVASATRTGVRLLAVVMDCATEERQFADAHKLFDYGFSQYSPYSMNELLSRLQSEIATVQIENAIETDPNGGKMLLKYGAVSGGDAQMMIQRNSESAMNKVLDSLRQSLNIQWNRELRAPVTNGELLGRVSFYTPDGTPVSAELVASRDIQAQPEPTPTPTPAPTRAPRGSGVEGGEGGNRGGARTVLLILVFALLAVAAVLLVSAARRERRRRVAARRRAAKRRQAARRSAGGTTSRTARSYSTRSDARRRSAQQDYRRRR